MKHSKKLLILGLLTAVLGPVGASAASVTDVQIINYSFQPSAVTINLGDSVRWTENDGPFHTTTSSQGLWDADYFDHDHPFTYAFNQAGNYPYYCIPHSSFMSGSVTVAGAPNVPPTVSIASPTNGATLSSTNLIAIQANASDTDGSVSQVEFFEGVTSLGVDSLTPFSVAVNLAPGNHTITAVATDNNGATTTSTSVTFYASGIPIADPIPDHIVKGNVRVELAFVVDGLASPTAMAVPDDGTKRIFVSDQIGLVYVITNGVKLASPLLDVRNRLVSLAIGYDERGLLGLAVHPQFAAHPLIYTYTSESNGPAADFTDILEPGVKNDHQSVIAEWQIDPSNPNRVLPGSRREILRIDEPQSNHNGGTMRFGPDGLLYFALGDGGNADDQGAGHLPDGNAQSTSNVYGKLLRIDVDARTSANGQYGVPLDNPFVAQDGVDEIYAYGFRNPYSFTFDRTTGDLWVGDVGQNKVEEVDVVVKGGNYGWHVKEGSFYFDHAGSGAGFVTANPTGPVPPDLKDPVAQYDHDEGTAVIGGYVYRGSGLAGLGGNYIFGDWGNFVVPSGRLFYLDQTNGIHEFRIGLDDRPLNLWIKGFGEDADGEVYILGSRVLGPGGNTGRILKIVPAPSPISISGIVTNGTNVSVSWTGGRGAFALQRKTDLSEPVWADSFVVAVSNALSPQDFSAKFLRVFDTAHQLAIPLSASLSGASEKPNAVTTSGTGFALFSLEENVLNFNVRYSGLSGPAILAHIHGPADTTGPAGVLIDLAPFNGGAFGSSGTLSGTIILTPAQRALILAGKTYVNVHTSANSSGEIRGQIAPVLMEATLNGANQRPTPVITPGTGSAHLSLVGTQLTLNVTYRNLTGPATLAHIHGPASAFAATGVLVDLVPLNGGSFGVSGGLAGTVTLTPQQLAYVIDGLTYLNVHTSVNGSGEIRGQILPKPTAVPLTASLTGLSEKPSAVSTPGTGLGSFSLEGDTLRFDVRFNNLSTPIVMAHIHGPGNSGQSVPVLIDLVPFMTVLNGTNGIISGSVTLTNSQKAAILSGQTYVNVHTTQNGAGEIRGQLSPVLYQAFLNSYNERPAVFTSGSGTAVMALVGTNLYLSASYAGLTGPATLSHIHGPAGLSASASVLVNLAPFNGGAFGVSGDLAGVVPLTAAQTGNLVDGQTYINVHTDANSTGEIRGQIFRPY
ncbi:MAG: hypothetical protein JWM16_5795 [Verrucomicrobiales bacterium]|nr:hypothetical protein [Verrucomicrobiales bacterium]